MNFSDGNEIFCPFWTRVPTVLVIFGGLSKRLPAQKYISFVSEKLCSIRLKYVND